MTSDGVGLTTKIGIVSAPGTCGELVQGQFRTGQDFLVTLPVDCWSTVRVEVDKRLPDVVVMPAHKLKARAAVRQTLALCGHESGGARVTVRSALQEGKGMASSTADIVAACRATAEALGQPLTPAQISALAHRIEPSDGVMYPGVVCYDHRQGQLIERLGALPPCDIVIVDLGSDVDTVAFNRIPKDYTPAELDELAAAYEWVKRGIQQQDLTLIGTGATLSARVNQRLLYKPQLEALIALAAAHGACGVAVAHSGTVVGMLFSALTPAAEAQLRAALRRYDDSLVVLCRTRAL